MSILEVRETIYLDQPQKYHRGYRHVYTNHNLNDSDHNVSPKEYYNHAFHNELESYQRIINERIFWIEK